MARLLSPRPGRMQRVLGLCFLGIGLALLLLWWRLGAGERRVRAWQPEILFAAQRHELDPALLAALVFAESRGDADAISSVGALGLCQLMPATAAEEAARQGISGPPYTPQDNLLLGAGYLKRMFDKWGGDEDLALLSYRLGPTAVRRAIDAAGSQAAWFEALQRQRPSPWGYREQILRMRQHFADDFTPDPTTP